MTITIRTHRALAVDQDGVECELDFSATPIEWHDPLVSRNGDELIVSYLSLDASSDCDNPWDETHGLEYQIFDDGHERNEWIDNQKEYPDADIQAAMDAGRFFWLERYEHSLVRYALMNESSSVDRQWDVAPRVGYLILDTDWAGDLTAIARSLCEEYTAWCNGDVYGIVHLQHNLTTGETNDAACWGYLGSDYAERVLAEEHAWYASRGHLEDMP